MSEFTENTPAPIDKSIAINLDLPPFTLRARGGEMKCKEGGRKATDPVGLSQSIIHTLRQNPEGWCDLQCVGANSLWVACAAYRLARMELGKRTNKSALVHSQSEYTANIGGKGALGICLHIFPIPMKDAI